MSKLTMYVNAYKEKAAKDMNEMFKEHKKEKVREYKENEMMGGEDQRAVYLNEDEMNMLKNWNKKIYDETGLKPDEFDNQYVIERIDPLKRLYKKGIVKTDDVNKYIEASMRTIVAGLAEKAYDKIKKETDPIKKEEYKNQHDKGMTLFRSMRRFNDETSNLINKGSLSYYDKKHKQDMKAYYEKGKKIIEI